MNIVVLGLARNCSGGIPTFFALLDSLQKSFTEVYGFIGENGSKDDTKARLVERSHLDSNFHVVDCSSVESITERLQRMAEARQLVLEMAKTAHRKHNFACVLVLDLDGILMSQHLPDIYWEVCALLQDDELFAVAASSRPRYYDLLALRCSLYNRDIYRDLRTRPEGSMSRFFYKLIYIHLFQRFFSTLLSFREQRVMSAFNGLAIYRADDYFKGSYLDKTLLMPPCEHVVLHGSISRETNRCMLIRSELRVAMPTEHSPALRSVFLSPILRRAALLCGMRTKI